MIRVLHIFHEMENGGTGHFVMNYYRHMDRSKVQFDFLTSVDGSGYFDEEIQALGGKLFHAYPFYKNPVKNYHDIARIVRENRYRIIHRHTGSAFGYFDLRAARHGGADHLILHAHNTDAGKPFVHRAARLLLKLDCHRFACSQEAGRFLFGKEAAFSVIPNAIDTERFAFSPDIRERMRQQLDVADKLVIGHVGRFHEQKNHKKLLSIFAEIHRQRRDSVLICVGTGEKLGEIKAYAQQLNLSQHILFLGQRKDVEHVLQTFDAFLFPSFYEGFPVAMIEAQTNGLKCFASQEANPASSNITGNVSFVSVAASDAEWADSVLGYDLTRDPDSKKRVIDAGYDISLEANKLEDFYIKL